MIKSMTGFGRSEIQNHERKIVVEIKSVNHRYCDLSVKMPKKLNMFETSVRTLLKEYVSRGKVDVFIGYEDYTECTSCVKYNEDVAKEYMACLEQMAKTFSLENDIKISSLSRYPDVFTIEEKEVDAEKIWQELSVVIEEAAKTFVEARLKEGQNLKENLLQKLKEILGMVSYIEERSPQIVKEYRDKIMNKVQELLGDRKIDDAILATELTAFAEKICVDEEIVRLKSHVENMEDCLNTGGNIGRKLDFIAQEMNREANTILSKANDILVSDRAIDLKTEIEKIREQIQNIE